MEIAILILIVISLIDHYVRDINMGRHLDKLDAKIDHITDMLESSR